MKAGIYRRGLAQGWGSLKPSTEEIGVQILPSDLAKHRDEKRGLLLASEGNSRCHNLGAVLLRS